MPHLPGPELVDLSDGPRDSTRWHPVWRRPGWIVGLLVLVPVAVLAMRVDFAFGDNFKTLAYVNRTPWRDILSPPASGAHDSVEYRPLYYPLVKLLWTIAGPNVAWWRLVNVLMIAVLVMLIIRIADRLRSGSSVVASVCLLTSLFGLHTFRFMLLGVPLNMYLMVGVATAGIVLVALETEWRWRDPTVVVLGLGSLWMLETGLIGCAIVVLGAMVRPRRFGMGAAVIVILGVAAYGISRLTVGGTPVLFHAETGFGFHELSIQEQQRDFGVFPALLYAYNSAAAALSLLLSEPRAGVFKVTGGVLGIDELSPPLPWQWLNLGTSLVATALIAVWVSTSRGTPERRFVKQVFLLSLVVNAGLSYLYTRDRIMATAGIFYALAFGVSVQAAIERSRHLPSMRRRVVVALLSLLMLAWSWRGATVFLALRDAAWSVQREWSVRFEQLGGLEPDPDQPTARLKQLLRDRIVSRELVDPETDPAVLQRWFERQY